jgi:hypothetical protein
MLLPLVEVKLLRIAVFGIVPAPVEEASMQRI